MGKVGIVVVVVSIYKNISTLYPSIVLSIILRGVRYLLFIDTILFLLD